MRQIEPLWVRIEHEGSLNMKSILLGMTVLVLLGGVAGQAQASLPENTINCAAFQKLANGHWYVGAATFKVGNTNMTLTSQELGPRSMNIGGADLYAVVEQKCGGPRN
jgi:hypothetical protein